MGVVYHRKEAKVGADSKAGWLCYVDRLGGYAYVKKFVFQAGKTYPDSGSSVEVYTSGTTTFLEEEVIGPDDDPRPRRLGDHDRTLVCRPVFRPGYGGQ